MNSSITLVFNQPAESNDFITFKDVAGIGELLSINYGFQIPLTGDINQDISNTKSYIDTTYNSTGKYVVTADYVLKRLTITDSIGGVLFFTLISNITGGRIDVSISNSPVIVPIEITGVNLTENTTNPCNLVDITIATNSQSTNITSPVNEVVTTNPFTITDVTRDSINPILITLNDTDTTASNSIFVPKIESSLFDLQVVTEPNANTLNIIWLGVEVPYFDLTYSLDNITFYSSTSFSGLLEGNHTLYIKDSIGCDVSIDFVIDAFQPNVFERSPYFKLSEQNSLTYVKREGIDDCTVFSNQTNTMSYEENTQVNNQSFKQLFQRCDGVSKQQLKTNYNNVTVSITDCDGVSNNLPLLLKSNNLDVTDVRDATTSSVSYLGTQFVGVSYVSGKTYDPITLLESGSYYLGSSVPSFMNKGDYISIPSVGWIKVKDVIYIDKVQHLVLDKLVGQTLIPLSVKVTSIYNKLPFEIYEFAFDFNSLNGDYNIKVNGLDSEFEAINYQSEWFNVKEKQFNTYVLDYYNSENNETNYSTGIRNKLRLQYSQTLSHLPSDTQEVYLTDTSAVLTEADYRDFYTLTIMPVPVNFARKIGLAISNDRLFLNGLSLIKNAEIEQERIGNSNLYSLTLQFVRTDYNFNNLSEDGSIVLPVGNQPLKIDDNANGLLFVK